MRHLILFLLINFTVSTCLVFGQSAILSENSILLTNDHEECTIGVANGSATADGRPMVWKTRDYSSAPNNEVKYNTSFKYNFISVSNAGNATYSWMGVNEHGFAIVNSLSTDLSKGDSGPGNGALMRDVLGNCLTVEEFQGYLDSTNASGRKTRANFGVIDSTGVAAIFETAGTIYWKFDAANSDNGYVIRTNFTINGGSTYGIERYNRSVNLISDFHAGDSLSYKSIIRYQMRDFSDSNSEPVPVPFAHIWSAGDAFGFINTSNSICRKSSVSAAVIHGVLPTEQAGLSTMWTILGQPATSVALPYWPVGRTPGEADGPATSALCDKSHEIRACLFDSVKSDYIDSYKLLDNEGGGLWTCTFPLEDDIFSETKTFLNDLRPLDVLPVNRMINQEAHFASSLLYDLQNCYEALISGVEVNESNETVELFPNPFTRNFDISYWLKGPSTVRIDVFSASGQKVGTFINEYQLPGEYTYRFDTEGNNYQNGLYFVNVLINNKLSHYKLLKISNR